MACTAQAATFSISYDVNSTSINANGIVFMYAPARSDVSFSIDDNQTLLLSTFQPYTYTDIGNFGHQTFNGSMTKRVTIGGVQRSEVIPLSLGLQPGFFNSSQSGTMNWNLDFSGDRKSLDLTIGATSGTGSHSGAFPATVSLSEVLDDPFAVMTGLGQEADIFSGLNLDASASYDIDSTGSIASWEWDLDYDGSNFTIDASGVTVTAGSATLQSLYTAGQQYTIGLRVTDNTGATHVTTHSLTAVPEPSSIAMLSLGGITLVMRRRRGKNLT